MNNLNKLTLVCLALSFSQCKSTGDKSTATTTNDSSISSPVVAPAKDTSTTVPAASQVNTGPSVSLEKDGSIIVSGEKVKDLAEMKIKVENFLLKMDKIPDHLDFENHGYEGMGMIGEMHDALNEAVVEAKNKVKATQGK